MNIEKHNATWRTIRKFLENDIEKFRDRLEKTSDPVKSAEIRGEIRQCRRIIASVEKEPDVPVVDNTGPLY